jgi:hypothetical protein
VTADAQPRIATLTDQELRVIAGEAVQALGPGWILTASTTVPGEVWLVHHDSLYPVFLVASYDNPGWVAVRSGYLKELGYLRYHLDAMPTPEAVAATVRRVLAGEGEVR